MVQGVAKVAWGCRQPHQQQRQQGKQGKQGSRRGHWPEACVPGANPEAVLHPRHKPRSADGEHAKGKCRNSTLLSSGLLHCCPGSSPGRRSRANMLMNGHVTRHHSIGRADQIVRGTLRVRREPLRARRAHSPARRGNAWKRASVRVPRLQGRRHVSVQRFNATRALIPSLRKGGRTTGICVVGDLPGSGPQSLIVAGCVEEAKTRTPTFAETPTW